MPLKVTLTVNHEGATIYPPGENERINSGKIINVRVVEQRGRQVTLSFDAPRDQLILRDSLVERSLSHGI